MSLTHETTLAAVALILYAAGGAVVIGWRSWWFGRYASRVGQFMAGIGLLR
jgi:hypothetical protein